MEDYIKCQLIVGGSLRQTLFLIRLLLLYTTHIKTCYVFLPVSTIK